MVSFTNFVLEFETQIRLSAFFGVLLVMATWEWVSPKLPQTLPRTKRWPANIGIVVLNTLLVRILFPVLPVGVAAIAEARGWGLFVLAPVPGWIAFFVSVLILDLAIYVQHVMFHKVPVLWRLHRMHHADTAIDVTTGARFHPIEIVLSIVIKMAVVALLGAPAPAVVVFEVLINATAMFNHANLSLPESVDRLLRLVMVTPDMHRVHHSTLRRETDSNYGFNLPWWDRLFGTYIAQPSAGHDGMVIGLETFRAPVEQRLDRMLLQPFR
ncbi:MAG: sterol desaturase family protein [Rhodospirillaceae bacterium]